MQFSRSHSVEIPFSRWTVPAGGLQSAGRFLLVHRRWQSWAAVASHKLKTKKPQPTLIRAQNSGILLDPKFK